MGTTNKRLGRPPKYGTDMEQVTAYIPKRIVKLAEELKKEHSLESFNEGLNMVVASADEKAARSLTETWITAREIVESHQEELEALGDLLNPASLLGKLDATEELRGHITDFMAERDMIEKLKQRIKAQKDKGYKSGEELLDWIARDEARRATDDFKFWIARKGLKLKKKKPLELLIYRKLVKEY